MEAGFKTPMIAIVLIAFCASAKANDWRQDALPPAPELEFPSVEHVCEHPELSERYDYAATKQKAIQQCIDQEQAMLRSVRQLLSVQRFIP